LNGPDPIRTRPCAQPSPANRSLTPFRTPIPCQPFRHSAAHRSEPLRRQHPFEASTLPYSVVPSAEHPSAYAPPPPPPVPSPARRQQRGQRRRLAHGRRHTPILTMRDSDCMMATIILNLSIHCVPFEVSQMPFVFCRSWFCHSALCCEPVVCFQSIPPEPCKLGHPSSVMKNMFMVAVFRADSIGSYGIQRWCRVVQFVLHSHFCDLGSKLPHVPMYQLWTRVSSVHFEFDKCGAWDLRYYVA
jgi:hypothetical protein